MLISAACHSYPESIPMFESEVVEFGMVHCRKVHCKVFLATLPNVCCTRIRSKHSSINETSRVVGITTQIGTLYTKVCYKQICCNEVIL